MHLLVLDLNDIDHSGRKILASCIKKKLRQVAYEILLDQCFSTIVTHTIGST